MAVPKRKVSRRRRNNRRSHDAPVAAAAGICPQCNRPKPVHRACPHCGYYKGKRVISIKE